MRTTKFDFMFVKWFCDVKFAPKVMANLKVPFVYGA